MARSRFDYKDVLDEIFSVVGTILPLVVDVAHELMKLRSRMPILCLKGPREACLDIDQGTYPYVTSSNTTAGAVATGSGFGPLFLDYVLGITKAYTTRVGSDLSQQNYSMRMARAMAARGNEFGSVTGRPRRCGWLDIVAFVAQFKSIVFQAFV